MNALSAIRSRICISLFVIAYTNTIAQVSKPIPVLIVDGFSNHDWQQTTKVTKWILEESGRFKVDISLFLLTAWTEMHGVLISASTLL